MELSDKKYRRVARWLDGEPVELTDSERSIAEEISRADLDLTGAFEVPPPDRARERASRHLRAALAPVPARFIRFARPVAGVAAAVLLALAAGYLLLPPRPVSQPAPTFTDTRYVTDVPPHDDANLDLDLISFELDGLTADIVQAETTGTFEAEIDSLQRRLDGFWLEEVEHWPDEI